MPLRLSSLPYGYVCRLRELLNPLETYNLQIVTMHRVDGLQPLQAVVTKDVLHVRYDEEHQKVILADGLFQPMNISCLEEGKETVLFNVSEMLNLYNLPDDIFVNKRFQRLYVNLLPSVVTAGWYIPYHQVISSFPKLESFVFHDVYKNWMQDLLAKGVTDKVVVVHVHRPQKYDRLFSFNADNLVEFIENRNQLIIGYAPIIMSEKAKLFVDTLVATRFREIEPGSCEHAEFTMATSMTDSKSYQLIRTKEPVLPM